MLGEKGLIQLYTGNGKGKTTAALGLALRAAGHGARVVIIQFMKSWNGYGELKALRQFKNITLVHTGRPKCVAFGAETEWDKSEVVQAFRLAQKYAAPQMCDLLILDEVTWAVAHGLLLQDELIKLLDNKPKSLEIVLTGRNAQPELIQKADLVSDVQEIKHPLSQGIKARIGVEY